MTDDHIKSEIAAYLAGGLTEARNRQIDMHMASCDKCHQAMNKARARQAHQNREALKKAATNRMPNLFLARQGKETGIDRPASRTPWVLGGLLLLSGGLYLAMSHPRGPLPVPLAPREARERPVQPSTTTLSVSSAAPVVAKGSPVPTPVPTPAPVPVASVPEPIQLTQEWNAGDSAIKSPLLMVVRNNETWEKLWSEMGQTAPLPPVKFGRSVVIGVFAGEQPNGSTVSLGRPRETDADIAVPYRIHRTEVAVSSMSLPSHPYVLSVLPRADKKIRLTQWETPE